MDIFDRLLFGSCLAPVRLQFRLRSKISANFCSFLILRSKLRSFFKNSAQTSLIFHNFLLTRLSNSYYRVSASVQVLILSVLTRLSNKCLCCFRIHIVLILSVLTRLSNLKLGSHRIVTFLRPNAVNTIDLIYTDLCPKQYTCLLVLDLFLRLPN